MQLNKKEILIVLLVFVLVNIFSAVYQQPISVNGGTGWDGAIYYDVAQQFANGQAPAAAAPFAYRFGLPLLVSILFKGHLLFGFKLLNIIAGALCVILLMIWLPLHLQSWQVRTILVVMFMTHFLSPIRFVYFYPVLTDAPSLVFIFAGLIVIHQIRNWPSNAAIVLLSALTFIGVLFREIVIVIPLALLFVTNPFHWENNLVRSLAKVKLPNWTLFLPLVCGGLGIALTHWIISQTNDYSFPRTVLENAYGHMFLDYVHAWFLDFGPFIFVLIYSWKLAVTYLASRQYMLIYLVAFAFLAWVGGGDGERYLWWAAPIVYVLLGKAIEASVPLLRSPALITLLVFSQALAQRVFWTLPDYSTSLPHGFPILVPLGNSFPYFDISPGPTSRSVSAIALAEYFLLGSVLLVWLSYRSNLVLSRQASEPAPEARMEAQQEIA